MAKKKQTPPKKPVAARPKMPARPKDIDRTPDQVGSRMVKGRRRPVFKDADA